jgi:hypothetical protein
MLRPTECSCGSENAAGRPPKGKPTAISSPSDRVATPKLRHNQSAIPPQNSLPSPPQSGNPRHRAAKFLLHRPPKLMRRKIFRRLCANPQPQSKSAAILSLSWRRTPSRACCSCAGKRRSPSCCERSQGIGDARQKPRQPLHVAVFCGVQEAGTLRHGADF